MVESGRIDHAHHAGNAAGALEDTLAFADAVQAAVDSTDPEETLILVTADHSHVFTIAGYPKRGNPILGLARSEVGALLRASDGRPYTTLGYANGPWTGDLLLNYASQYDQVRGGTLNSYGDVFTLNSKVSYDVNEDIRLSLTGISMLDDNADQGPGLEAERQIFATVSYSF